MKWSSIRPVCVFGPGWDQDTESRIWKTTDVEILIVNLSRPDLRRKFFKPSIPADEGGTIVSIIEELVARVVQQNFSCVVIILYHSPPLRGSTHRFLRAGGLSLEF